MPKDYSKLVDDIKTDGLDGYNECAENGHKIINFYFI